MNTVPTFIHRNREQVREIVAYAKERFIEVIPEIELPGHAVVRLAAYELTKLIAPNNVSVVRIRDYEDCMKWLSDASKLKLNPQIP